MEQDFQPKFISGRNSAFRSAATPATTRIAEFIDDKMPFVTPDHVSFAGAAAVLAVDLYAATTKKTSILHGIILGAVHGVASAFDGVDGKLAGLKANERCDEDKTRGVLVDVGLDKVQEIATPIAHAVMAAKRKDWIGFAVGLTAAGTAVYPALSRSDAEENRILVEEGGKSKKQFFGTRVGRGIVNSFIIGLPVVGKIPAQTIGDAFVTYENIKVGNSRRKAAKDQGKSISKDSLVELVEAGKMTDEERCKLEAEFAIAPRKTELLKKINAGGLVAVAATAVIVPHVCAKNR